jgi:hypothetical protein
MNLTKFSRPEDTFELMGYTVWFCFKSAASIGFEMGYPRMTVQVGKTERTRVKPKKIHGTLEVHCPCEDEIKTRVRIHFHKACDYKFSETEPRPAQLRRIARKIFDVLEITDPELFAYEVLFILPRGSVLVAHNPSEIY